MEVALVVSEERESKRRTAFLKGETVVSGMKPNVFWTRLSTTATRDRPFASSCCDSFWICCLSADWCSEICLLTNRDLHLLIFVSCLGPVLALGVPRCQRVLLFPLARFRDRCCSLSPDVLSVICRGRIGSTDPGCPGGSLISLLRRHEWEEDGPSLLPPPLKGWREEEVWREGVSWPPPPGTSPSAPA